MCVFSLTEDARDPTLQLKCHNQSKRSLCRVTWRACNWLRVKQPQFSEEVLYNALLQGFLDEKPDTVNYSLSLFIMSGDKYCYHYYNELRTKRNPSFYYFFTDGGGFLERSKRQTTGWISSNSKCCQLPPLKTILYVVGMRDLFLLLQVSSLIKAPRGCIQGL